MTAAELVKKWGEDLRGALADGNVDVDEPLGDDVAEGWRQISVALEQVRDELVAIALGKGDPPTVVDEARIAAALLLALADHVEAEHSL